MELRPYTNADFPAVVIAMESFQSYLASIDPLQLTRSGKDFDSSAYTKLCVEQSQAPNAIFLLAVEGTELLGFLVAAPRKTTKKDAEDEKPNPKAEVLELFVHESHRSKKSDFPSWRRPKNTSKKAASLFWWWSVLLPTPSPTNFTSATALPIA